MIRKTAQDILSLTVAFTLLIIMFFIVYWGFVDNKPIIQYKGESEVLTPVVELGGTLELKIVYVRNRACPVIQISEYYNNTTTGSFKKYDRFINEASNSIVRDRIGRVIVTEGLITVYEKVMIPKDWDTGYWSLYAVSTFKECTTNPIRKDVEMVISPTVSFKVVEELKDEENKGNHPYPRNDITDTNAG